MLQKILSFLSKEQFKANYAFKSMIKLREFQHGGGGRGFGKGKKVSRVSKLLKKMLVKLTTVKRFGS